MTIPNSLIMSMRRWRPSRRPDHVEPDALPARSRFYRHGVGPSRWLMAVVSYEQEPARIITRWPTGRTQSDGKP